MAKAVQKKVTKAPAMKVAKAPEKPTFHPAYVVGQAVEVFRAIKIKPLKSKMVWMRATIEKLVAEPQKHPRIILEAYLVECEDGARAPFDVDHIRLPQPRKNPRNVH